MLKLQDFDCVLAVSGGCVDEIYTWSFDSPKRELTVDELVRYAARKGGTQEAFVDEMFLIKGDIIPVDLEGAGE